MTIKKIAQIETYDCGDHIVIIGSDIKKAKFDVAVFDKDENLLVSFDGLGEALKISKILTKLLVK